MQALRIKIAIVCAVAMIFAISANAQVTSTTNSASFSWGGWGWQADRAPITLTLTGTGSFNTPPGLVQIPVNIASGITVHEIHGNFALATWQGGTCGKGSIIAQIRDQLGNALAAVKLQQFGVGSSNVPINGTFATPVSVTALQIQFFVDLCGPQTVQFAFSMN